MTYGRGQNNMGNLSGFIYESRPVKVYDVSTQSVIAQYSSIKLCAQALCIKAQKVNTVMKYKSVIEDKRTGRRITIRPVI
jgi:hypothetical protein